MPFIVQKQSHVPGICGPTRTHATTGFTDLANWFSYMYCNVRPMRLCVQCWLCVHVLHIGHWTAIISQSVNVLLLIKGTYHNSTVHVSPMLWQSNYPDLFGWNSLLGNTSNCKCGCKMERILIQLSVGSIKLKWKWKPPMDDTRHFDNWISRLTDNWISVTLKVGCPQTGKLSVKRTTKQMHHTIILIWIYFELIFLSSKPDSRWRRNDWGNRNHW